VPRNAAVKWGRNTFKNQVKTYRSLILEYVVDLWGIK
jgi:hypothetical protein